MGISVKHGMTHRLPAAGNMRWLRSIHILLLIVCAGCGPKPQSQPAVAADMPVIWINQFSEVPGPGQSQRIPTACVVALWRDGRIFRCASEETVGKSYIKGTLPAATRAEFFTYLATLPTVPKEPSHPAMPHDPSRYVVSRLHGTNMVQSLPWREESPWHEVKQRLLSLPLENSRPATAQEADSFGRMAEQEWEMEGRKTGAK